MAKRLLLFAALGLLAGADTPKEAAEWKKLEGTWRLVTLDDNGRRFEQRFGAFDRMTITGRKLFAEGEGRREEWGALRIDLATTPSLMDLKEAAGGAKGNTAEGIYQFDGDSLMICLGLGTAVKERPTKFPTEPTPGVFYLVLKREKP